MPSEKRSRRSWLWWVLVPPLVLLLLVGALALYQSLTGDGDIPFSYALW